jgi:Flp pilus assembly protein TadD
MAERAGSLAWIVCLCALGCTLHSPLDDAEPQAFDDVHLELVQKIAASGRHHAALAHLDALPAGIAASPHARLLRADSLRQLGKLDAATDAYAELVRGPLAGLARRGLGLIAAQRGDLARALVELESARRAAPTDARVRNDYGYALLLDGQIEAASDEIATAMQLDLADERCAANFVLLLSATGRSDAAVRLAEQRGIGATALAEIQAEAVRIARHWDVGAGTTTTTGEGR